MDGLFSFYYLSCVNQLKIITDNYEALLAVALKITGCHHKKYDLLNNAYLKLDSIVKKDPDKEINFSYVYFTMRSIFVSEKRKEREVATSDGFFVNIIEQHDKTLSERIEVSECLDSLPFMYREVLLKSAEIGMKELHRRVNLPYKRIISIKNEAMKMLKNEMESKSLTIEQ